MSNTTSTSTAPLQSATRGRGGAEPLVGATDNDNSARFLRRVLAFDAVSCLMLGLPMMLFAGPVASTLALPAGPLRGVGLFLIGFAAFVAWVASRVASPVRVPRLAVWVVIIGNALWAVDSIGLLFTGWVAPNAIGQALIVAQALVTLVLAELEWFGLRRLAR